MRNITKIITVALSALCVGQTALAQVTSEFTEVCSLPVTKWESDAPAGGLEFVGQEGNAAIYKVPRDYTGQIFLGGLQQCGQQAPAYYNWWIEYGENNQEVGRHSPFPVNVAWGGNNIASQGFIQFYDQGCGATGNVRACTRLTNNIPNPEDLQEGDDFFYPYIIINRGVGRQEYAMGYTTSFTNIHGQINLRHTVSKVIIIFEEALPVTLVNFDVTRSDAGNRLEWRTSSESDSDLFQVERSRDGRSFSSIGKTKATGNSNYSQSYSYLDQVPLKGMNYYRLRCVDLDGSFTLSRIVSLYSQGFGEEKKVSLSQDNSTLILNFQSSERGAEHITIWTLGGKAVFSTNYQYSAGLNHLNFSVGALPNGLYVVQFNSGDCQTTSKFVKF